MRRIDILWMVIIIILIVANKYNSAKNVTIERIVTDTVEVVRIDSFFIEKEVPIEVVRTIEKPTFIYRDVENKKSNLFIDTTFIQDDFFMFYSAYVDGTLNSINLGYYDNCPDSIVTNTITKTIINTDFVSRNKLYLGGSVNNQSSVTLGAAYQWKKNWLQLGYDFNSKGVRIGYYHKIR